MRNRFRLMFGSIAFLGLSPATLLCSEPPSCQQADGIHTSLYPSPSATSEEQPVKEKWHCRRGKPHGLYEAFADDGAITLRTQYKKGVRHGWERHFDTLTGQISQEVHFRNGKEHGPVRKYLQGRLLFEASFVNGAYDGLVRSYYDNGRMRSLGRFRNGERVGQHDEFYPDGSLESRSVYLNGRKHGQATSYGERGEKEVAEYRNDFLEGITRRFSPSGRLLEELTYRQGALNGSYRKYFMGGLLAESAYYANGKRTGAVEVYFPSGALQSRYHFLSDKRHGPFVEYHANGRTALEGRYLSDKLHGYRMKYNEQGTLVARSVYDHGKFIPRGQRMPADAKPDSLFTPKTPSRKPAAWKRSKPRRSFRD